MDIDLTEEIRNPMKYPYLVFEAVIRVCSRGGMTLNAERLPMPDDSQLE